ncbi:nucleotide sugar dehydrogenase [Streptomyces sp. MBT49]|uniref:nucleotide sugar dehydrogenase n=1 Tax=Streptomyces sp. MBT49 TaxID=1488380 RepID=UPI00190C12F2|nr:nucleotide sugar dehydrogenase [Streptomyces sp. MBT49]MBK3627044.1 nucleotide sugar dehydrogenase [Streptomyces sp. MBT49]
MDTADDGELCVWGLGLIGYSLAGALARAGRTCVVMDVNPERVARLNRGELPFHHLPYLPDDFRAEVVRGTLRATTEVADVLQPGHAVHILCVPTEANGGIDASALHDVVGRLAEGARARPLYLIIESTIAPAWLDSAVHKVLGDAGWRRGLDYHVGVSPRRDWLTDRERDMASTPKVIGGDSPEIVALMRRLYAPVCDEVFEARDARHAAMVKVVENYFRYRDIMLACELSLALPDFDVADILRLASTKWNMDLYHPSLGIGGYCVPLAKDYLGTETGAREAVAALERVEEDTFSTLRQAVWQHGPVDRVAVLGIAYAANMKIHTRSPSIPLIRDLRERGAEVCAHDPLYSPSEVQGLTGARPLRFPEGLRHCDTVILMTGHTLYRTVDDATLRANTADAVRIFDNHGIWLHREFGTGTRYLEVGGRHFQPWRGTPGN